MNDCLIPIIIGITGHLDLKGESKIEQAVKSILIEVKKLYPNTPIKILSPLAEGADRLVARVGMQSGAKLWAVVPMPIRHYMDDFDETSKAEFEKLFNQKEAVFELPLLPGNTEENIKGYDAPRNSQYAAVGTYVAYHSNILIAIWNGTDTGQEGGTADIIRFQLEGIPEKFTGPRNLLEAVDNGPVYHIFAARSKKQTDITTKPEKLGVDCLVESRERWDILYPKGWKHGINTPKEEQERIQTARSYYGKALKAINEYNKNVNDSELSDILITRKYREYLFDGLKEEDVDKFEQSLSSGTKSVLNYYATVECLAGKRQLQTVKELRTVIIMAFSAFMIWSVYSAIWPMTYSLLLFVSLMVVTYLMKKKSDKEEVESQYYDYRTLAEGLRAQFYWKYLGLKENVYETYSSKYRGEIGWIRHAIKAASMKVNLEIRKGLSPVGTNENVGFVKRHWIDGQASYFAKGISKRKVTIKANSKYTPLLLTGWGLTIASFFALKVIAIIKNPGNIDILSMEDVKEWKLYNILEICFDFFLAATAAWATFLEKRGTKDEVKQFHRMNIIFAQAKELLEKALKAGDLYMARRVIIETGQEAITENGDWLLMQRSRPVEVPLG
ncbi:hypothetical protein D4S03_06705 [bacterium]|nr:MAG: hypothetical protein D4S03_06705 [bacterium]